MNKVPNFPPTHPLLNRRRFLADAGLGLGAIALTQLLGEQGLLAASVSGREPLRPSIEPGHPYAPRPAHFTARAKNVLLIFCSGACMRASSSASTCRCGRKR